MLCVLLLLLSWLCVVSKQGMLGTKTVQTRRFVRYPYAACSGFASALMPREKAPGTLRNRGFVRLIHTAHRRDPAVSLVPREKLENRTKPRLCMVYLYGAPYRKKRLCTVFSTGVDWNHTVAKTVQRRTTPNCTTWCMPRHRNAP